MTRALKHEMWQELISDYRNSGLNAQSWCREHKLTISSLHYWINKLNKESLKSDSCFNHEFVPINQVVIPLNPSAPLVIRYQNLSIDVFEDCHPDTLRNVLSILNIYA